MLSGGAHYLAYPFTYLPHQPIQLQSQEIEKAESSIMEKTNPKAYWSSCPQVLKQLRAFNKTRKH